MSAFFMLAEDFFCAVIGIDMTVGCTVDRATDVLPVGLAKEEAFRLMYFGRGSKFRCIHCVSYEVNSSTSSISPTFESACFQAFKASAISLR